MAVHYTTDIGKVRLQIPDIDENPLFTDEEIQVFLDIEDGDIKGALALALETIAGDHLLTYRFNVRSDDATVTASETAKLLVDRATRARKEAAAYSVGFSIVGGETVWA